MINKKTLWQEIDAVITLSITVICLRKKIGVDRSRYQMKRDVSFFETFVQLIEISFSPIN